MADYYAQCSHQPNCDNERRSSQSAYWNLARMVAVYPYKNGVVRIIEVSDSHSTKKRAISVIIPLPTDK